MVVVEQLLNKTSEEEEESSHERTPYELNKSPGSSIDNSTTRSQSASEEAALEIVKATNDLLAALWRHFAYGKKLEWRASGRSSTVYCTYLR